MAEYSRSKNRLFSESPWTYTRCQENVQGYQIIVGGFAPAGLYVNHIHGYGNVNVGVADELLTNIDTDTQWAFCQPIKKYMDDKSAYLQDQLGNPEGADKPNKKYIDPRGWLHVGEKGMAARLVEAFKDLNSYGQFEF